MSNPSKSLEDRLESHPELRAQIMALLEIAESNIELADEVEERVIEATRDVGKGVIETWACRQEQSYAENLASDAEARRHGKKTPLDEHLWRALH